MNKMIHVYLSMRLLVGHSPSTVKLALAVTLSARATLGTGHSGGVRYSVSGRCLRSSRGNQVCVPGRGNVFSCQ